MRCFSMKSQQAESKARNIAMDVARLPLGLVPEFTNGPGHLAVPPSFILSPDAAPGSGCGWEAELLREEVKGGTSTPAASWLSSVLEKPETRNQNKSPKAQKPKIYPNKGPWV